jgi:hypothetical protein
MQNSGDLDADGDLSSDELAYGLDQAVSNFIEDNSLSADDYGAIQQEVLNLLADELNELDTDSILEIAINDAGDADAASVIAALDDNFDDLVLHESLDVFDPVIDGSELV